MTPVEALERVVHCLDRAHETGFKTKAFVRALDVVRNTPAEEIAARTVNKERARKGEAATSSRLSRTDISSGRRGGLRSGTKRTKGRAKEQLYNEAKHMGIEGRSRMTKAQLERAVDRHKK